MDALLKEIEELQSEPEFVAEELVLALTNRICEIMERDGVSRAELARRLGTSRAFVTSFLNGKPNMTVATLVRVSCALGVRPSVRFEPWPAETRRVVPAVPFYPNLLGSQTRVVMRSFLCPEREAKTQDAVAEATLVPLAV